MEHFVLKVNDQQVGLIPILEDDYDSALAKAKSKAKRKVNVLTEVELFHRTQDKWTDNLTLIMTIKDK